MEKTLQMEAVQTFKEERQMKMSFGKSGVSEEERRWSRKSWDEKVIKKL